jgi:hypothetical protein
MVKFDVPQDTGRAGQPGLAHCAGEHLPAKPTYGRTSVFGAERLTGALLDRLTHDVYILEMNGDS